MRRLSVVALALALALAGCATPITHMDGDTYMVGKTSAGGIFSTSSGPKSDVYEMANAFCSDKGRQVETVKLDTKDAVPFVRSSSADLQFRCVAKP